MRFGVFISFSAFFVVILLVLIGAAMSCAPSVKKPTLSHSTIPEGKTSLETTTSVFNGYMDRLENDEVVCYASHHDGLQCKWKDKK